MLERFSNDYVLKIEGIVKDVYLDDYEHGELEGVSFSFDYADGEFTLNGNEGKHELTQIVVNHLRDKLHQNNIESNWIAINDNTIMLAMTENADGFPIDNVQEYWDNGRNVYSCYYFMKLFINGKRLMEEDLIELFDFEY